MDEMRAAARNTWRAGAPARQSWTRRSGFAAGALTLAFGIFGSATTTTSAQAGGPDPRQVSRLGKALFFDATLSNPAGMSCSTCHNPDAGFTYPISAINVKTGTVPGVVTTRFGNRKPQTISYARFIPPGPPTFDPNRGQYVGGLFWDGRASDLEHQAAAPLQNPNEMNNLVHNVGSPALVVAAVQKSPNAALFKQVYGANVFQLPVDQVFQLVVRSIAMWERTPEVNPFSSKYDAYVLGQATLTPQELNGLRLFTGSVTGRPGGPRFTKNAQCSSCHSVAPAGAPNPDLFTNNHYANAGVPRNSSNPFYTMTDPVSNPAGYNPLGYSYRDLGLGDFLYPLQGKPAGDFAEGDPLRINGMFKIPTLRNVDKRPYPLFIKDYGHNGFFKSLKRIVHFYNTRNLTTLPGEVIDFRLANPYAVLKGKPIWPAPEYRVASTLTNPAGIGAGPGPHLGNLGLTDQEENDIVAFLTTLSDGFFQPQAPPKQP
jgi:cytochrome c peroxidase